VRFFDPLSGYAVGEGGTILSTKDGGETWRREGSCTTLALQSVYMVSPDAAIVIGNDGAILKSPSVIPGSARPAKDGKDSAKRSAKTSRQRGGRGGTRTVLPPAFRHGEEWNDAIGRRTLR
jgi:hypothetical protein